MTSSAETLSMLRTPQETKTWLYLVGEQVRTGIPVRQRSIVTEEKKINTAKEIDEF